MRPSREKSEQGSTFSKLFSGRSHLPPGLTMIELLVVLAILAVLILFAMVQLTAYLSRSRDNLRKNHLEKYRVAMEEYFNDRLSYPPTNALSNCGSDELLPYIPEIYCDPVTKQPYRYVVTPDGTGYSVFATLENKDDPIISDRGCADGCGPDDNQDGQRDYNYGVTEKQAAIGDSVDSVTLPTCSGPEGLRCTPNRCRSCCPGVGWRCNALGNACERDLRCN